MKKLTCLILLFYPLLLLAQQGLETEEYFYVELNNTGKSGQGHELVKDSVKLVHRKSGDTLFYQIVSHRHLVKGAELQRLKKSAGYGNTLQPGIKLKGGRTVVYELATLNFLVKSDSLYQYSKVYTLSEDSVKKLWRKQESPGTDSKGKERIDKIIRQNSTMDYTPVFSPHFFNRGETELKLSSEKGMCGKTVLLRDYWIVDGKRYYDILLSNRCGKNRSAQRFVFGEDMKLVKFGDYYNAEAMLLNSENSRFRELLNKK